MNNKKHILNLDQFRDILQIFPKVGNKKFKEPPLEKEIAFLASLGHSGEIRKITDVNVNWHYARDDPMFTTINVISRNEDTQLYGTILPAELTNEDIRNSESYKEYYAIASGKIPPKTKASKKKADSDATTKQKPPTVPEEKKGKKSGKGKQKAKGLETISKAILTEAEQLKIITKRSRKETHSSYASGSGVDEGTGVSPGVPDAPDYDSDDDISWKSSEDDPNQDTGVDAIFEHKAEATSLVDIYVTAIAELSFFAPTNRPPTLTPLFTQLQQPLILTPTTTPSSSLQNLP
ncbi:hypothetical protein Tco_1529264, partial [Tanacetum coccineum]